MAELLPAISASERKRREALIKAIARRLGFLGDVEYLHVISGAGGAQFGLGRTAATDLLVVYGEAFLRDADPDDFSLIAILAHERGHQLIHRHRALRKWGTTALHEQSEEVLASVIGALLVWEAEDQDALLEKALDDALNCGLTASRALKLIRNLKNTLEALL